MYTKSFIIYLGIFLNILLNTLSFYGVGQDKPGNEDLFANEKKYSTPNYIVLSDTCRVIELLYEGPDYKENSTEVFAYYSNPDLLRGKKVSGKKYPGIILLHGGGGTAFKEWVELWAAEGFAAFAMDMSGSGKDRISLTNGGPKGDTQDKFIDIENGPTHTWSYYSVCSILKAHSLLRSFPEVDTTNTFITGISWGGYLTCMLAGIDNRYKAAAPVYGCGYFDLMEGPRKRLNELAEKEKGNWLKYLDPSVYLTNARCKMFFINGNKDFFFNLEPFHYTYELIPDSNRIISIIPDYPHGHYPGWSLPELRYFFKSFTIESNPLPSIGAIRRERSKINCRYESLVSIFDAQFHYTNDGDINSNSTWQNKKMHIESGLLLLELDNVDFRVGFVQIIDNRGLRVSSDLIFNTIGEED